MIKDREILHCDTVDRICEAYFGKIYEGLLDVSLVHEFEREHYVLMQQYEGNQVKVRFYAEEMESEDWNVVQPNLEDVFMCEYRDSILTEEVG